MRLNHLPFGLNRVSPPVIAGLDPPAGRSEFSSGLTRDPSAGEGPAIHVEKTLRRPCRNGFGCGKSARMRGSSPRMLKETVRMRMEWSGHE
jgi:hypothetical protein